jgi:hypothetical protein
MAYSWALPRRPSVADAIPPSDESAQRFDKEG